MQEGPNETVNEDKSEQEIPKQKGLRRVDGKHEQLIREQEEQYTEGELLRFVRVRFPGNARSFPFLTGKRDLRYGQKVLAMSDRGMAVGYINSFPYEMKFRKAMLPLRSIKRIATDQDVSEDLETYKKQKQAEMDCKELIEKFELDMNLTHVELTQFGKKVVFYFTAPSRVDFRAMVKELVGRLKTRVELRQISVRDRSASLGGIGPCGRQLCCSSFLSRYGSVNLKMAKNQNLTLNFSKLNGVCGQLKCCLQYEDEVYENKRRLLPKEGELIECVNGDRGRVERLHLLSEQFEMLTTEGVRRRYALTQYLSDQKADFHMPKRFDHVSNETSTVIGLSDEQAERSREFEKEIQKLREQTKGYAEQVFENLFGTTSLKEDFAPEERS